MSADLPIDRALALITLATSLITHALPAKTSWGVSCAECHHELRSGEIRVTPQDLRLDLGTQLDGTTRGPLDTIQVEPGGTARISLDILQGQGAWAAVVEQLGKGGQARDQTHFLQWSLASPSGWKYYADGNYLATSTLRNTGSKTLTLELALAASTPEDTYEVWLTIAGRNSGLFYGQVPFYLDVAKSQPATFAGYPVDAQGLVDTGSWLGWLHVSEEAKPWVYCYALSRYIYLPESFVSEAGGWVYIGK